MIWLGYNPTTEWMIPVLLLYMNCGVLSGFHICFLSNELLFPTLFCSTSMGICNVFSRTVTITAPVFAELEGKTPMWIVFGIAMASIMFSRFIAKPELI